ncbi:MAG: hypothetical protein ACOCWF_07570, partial [Halochromatium sp.]
LKTEPRAATEARQHSARQVDVKLPSNGLNVTLVPLAEALSAPKMMTFLSRPDETASRYEYAGE